MTPEQRKWLEFAIEHRVGCRLTEKDAAAISAALAKIEALQIENQKLLERIEALEQYGMD